MENQETKKRGRKPLDKDEKVFMVSVYLKNRDKEAIVNKYGSVTEAIKQEVLSKLEKFANL